MNWRRALRWVLWNPKRLFLTFGAVILLVVVIGSHASGGSKATHHKLPQTQTTNLVSGSTSTTTGSSGTTSTLPAPVAQAAVTFVTDYARPSLPEPKWYGALKPLATPDLDNVLADQQPWSVTAHKVTGPATGSVNGSTATVTVPTDTGAVYVTLEANGSSWLVSDVEQAAS